VDHKGEGVDGQADREGDFGGEQEEGGADGGAAETAQGNLDRVLRTLGRLLVQAESVGGAGGAARDG
jgi:hypothetical protein